MCGLSGIWMADLAHFARWHTQNERKQFNLLLLWYSSSEIASDSFVRSRSLCCLYCLYGNNCGLTNNKSIFCLRSYFLKYSSCWLVYPLRAHWDDYCIVYIHTRTHSSADWIFTSFEQKNHEKNPHWLKYWHMSLKAFRKCIMFLASGRGTLKSTRVSAFSIKPDNLRIKGGIEISSSPVMDFSPLWLRNVSTRR